MNRALLYRIATLLAAVALGIGTGPKPAASQKVVDLPARDRSVALTMEEVFSVGSISGEEWETFSRVAGVAFDGEGNLYLLDADNFRVVKVGPDGMMKREMGGEGGGPGEFGMPYALSVSRDGEVGVFDLGYGGFAFFGSDGSYLRSVPMSEGLRMLPSADLHSHPGGGIVSGAGGGVRIRRGPDGGMSFPESRPVHLLSMAEEVEVDTIYEGWNPATAYGEPRLETSGGGGVTIQAPPLRAFDPGLMIGVFPDGRIAVVDSTTYEVKILGPDGGARKVIRRPLEPRDVTRRDREEEKARRLKEMEASGGPTIVMRTERGTSRMASDQAKAMMESRVESMEFAQEVPVVAGIAIDWEGRIWVRRQGGRVGDTGPVDLIAADGTYLGTLPSDIVPIPDAFGPNGLAAFVETDELGIPRVVVRRLTIG